MGEDHYKKLSPEASRAARFMEMFVNYVLGTVTLPAYALVALAVWFAAGRDVVDGWQLVPIVFVYWLIEPGTNMAILWSRPTQRESRRLHLVADTLAQLIASVLAWWVVSDFAGVGAAAGLAAGLIFSIGWCIYLAIGERRRPADPEKRQAENEAAMRALLFPDRDKHES